MIRAQIDEILDGLPEEELENVYWSIKFIQENYLFKKNLLDKGVMIEDLFEEAEEIKDLWDSAFAKNVNEEMRESIHYDQFKWHIFSYEKQDCFKGSAARKAFDAVFKDELYVMYQNSPYIMQYSKADKVIAADFDSQQDIYIFDKHFTWTYVHTHEETCGPYFYSLN
ncbi:DUF4275 family protein [Sporosarcina sp. ACRSM]|uniref:DUF4275 family protein n=1 Tax=Sporosarcina sp. ACRSM TaxID=2918216 RepID=UPI001EF3E82E|nr:DUF4275 family protein [Sporosarcina sp. ACRSM]MCG7336107.1 DUF4275 family protein [Sporosarcina sp. ACRSM]